MYARSGSMPTGRASFSASSAVARLCRQQRRSDDPLVPPAVLRDPIVRSGLAGGLVSGGVLYTLSAYVPLWMVAHGGHGALGAGVALVPLLAGTRLPLIVGAAALGASLTGAGVVRALLSR